MSIIAEAGATFLDEIADLVVTDRSSPYDDEGCAHPGLLPIMLGGGTGAEVISPHRGAHGWWHDHRPNSVNVSATGSVPAAASMQIAAGKRIKGS